MNWKNKRVLVTGSEGLIGKELVIQLKELGAIVGRFDIKRDRKYDITDKEAIEKTLRLNKPDCIFHLFGIKGNPKMTKEKPVDFMGPMLQGDTNVILAAQKYGVKRFLYTSSIAVENPETDKYPAWTKLTAEHLIEAMRIQYPKGTQYCIVRPSNVYGEEDLDKDNLMVVSKLLKEAITTKQIVLDKDGSKQIRDIIHARDVAKGMIKAMEDMPSKPVNLCSGKQTKIDDIAKEIAKNLKINIIYKNLNIVLGPNKKVMKNPYINPEISLNQGIKEVIDYVKNK